MRRTFKTILFLSCITGCASNLNQSDIKDFNSNAKNSFLKKNATYNLDPLRDFEKCILKETIANDLDQLNDWRIVEIENKFLIRTYHTPYLDLDFAFVKCRDRFSFVTLPDVVKYIYGVQRHYQEQGDDWILRDSSAMFSINSELLNDFLNDSTSAIKGRSSFEKATLLNRLLPEIFSSPFFHPISLFEFKNITDKQIKAGEMKNYDYNKVRKLIETVHPSAVPLCSVFFMEGVGWVLLNFPEENLADSKVKVDAYFIALRKRSIIMHGEERTKYLRCREQFD